MPSNMLHYASILLIVVIGMTEITVATQISDRQDECNDGPFCGNPRCETPRIARRCAKTCGTCAAEEAISTTTEIPTTTERKLASRNLLSGASSRGKGLVECFYGEFPFQLGQHGRSRIGPTTTLGTFKKHSTKLFRRPDAPHSIYISQ